MGPEGYVFGSWDYSQLEMRVMAHISRCPALTRAFLDGIDVHAQTAYSIFGVKAEEQDESLHRLPAKTTGFGILMRISPVGLHELLTAYERARQRNATEKGLKVTPVVWSLDDCERFITVWLDTYPGVRRYQQEREREVEEHGIVRDFYGRRFLLPQVWCAQWKLAEHARRQSSALPIQSGAQVVVKRAMARIPEALTAFEGSVHPLLQVHDDLDFEVRRKSLRSWDRTLRRIMTTTTELSVPIEVDGKAGPSWGELEKIPSEKKRGKIPS